MKKIKVLLADDHAIVRDGLRSIMAGESDLELVGEAVDGREAVEKAKKLLPDVIVMDIEMPKMSGLEATRQLKSAHPHICILVLTVHEDDEYVFNLLKAGVSGYLLKRTAGSELVSAIRAVYYGDSVLSSPLAQRLVEEYLEQPRKKGAKKFSDGLTGREVEVLKLIAQGASNKEIAKKLYLSIKTVESHRTNIFRKLEIHDRTQAAVYAVRKGLLEGE